MPTKYAIEDAPKETTKYSVEDAPAASSEIYINPDHGNSSSSPSGLYDKVTGAILDVFKPLSPEERGGIDKTFGKNAGAAVTGLSNAALGVSSGALGFAFHPLSSIYGTAQTAADALNQLFPDAGLNPKQKAAKDASLKRLKEQWDQIKDNPDFAIGNLAGGIIAGQEINEALPKFKGAATRGLEATSERFRKGMQKVVGGGEKVVKAEVKNQAEAADTAAKKTEAENVEARVAHQQDVRDTRAANVTALKEHLGKVDEAAKEREAAKAIPEARTGLESEIKAKSTERAVKIEQAEKNAKEDLDKRYADQREMLNDEEIPPSLNRGDLSSLNIGEKAIDAYEAFITNPEAKLPAPLKAIQGRAGEKLGWRELQGIRSVLSKELSSGKLNGEVYQGYKAALGVVDDGLQKIADNFGMGDEVKKLRADYAHFMQTFHEPISEPTTVARKTQTTTSPDYVRSSEETARREALNKYDPSIGKLGNEIDSSTERLSSLPSEKSARAGLKESPEPPEMAKPKPLEIKEVKTPEINTRALREKFIDDKLAQWTSVTRYQLERLVAGPIGLLISTATGSRLGEVASIAYTIGSTAPFIIQNLLEKPAFRQWFTRPPKGELEALQKIPYADRVKITDGLNRAVAHASMSGKPFKLNPAVASFLAANTRINGPKTQQLQDIRDKFSQQAPQP